MTDLFHKRLETFQKNPELEVVKKRSEDYNLKLRKSKRNELVQKRRQQDLTETDISSYALYLGVVPDLLLHTFPELQQATSEESKLKIYSEILKYPQIPEHFLTEILKILTNSLSATSPMTDPRPYFIKHEIIPILCSFIINSSDPDLIIQSIWCLNNMLAGQFNYSEEVLNTGVVSKLLELLDQNDHELIENISFCFANLIADSPEVCRMVLKSDYFARVAALEYFSNNLAHSISFCLSSIALHSKYISLDNCVEMIKILERTFDQDPVVCLVGLENLTRFTVEFVKIMINSKLMSQVLNGIKGSKRFCFACLRIVANISTGGVEEEFFLIRENILETFWEVLKGVDDECCMNIYWTLGNLAAGTPETRELVGRHRICLEFEFVFNHSSNAVRLEGSNFYKNLLNFASVDCKNMLIEAGIFKDLAGNFLGYDIGIVCNCLSIARLLLNTEKYTGRCVIEQFSESGCLTNLNRVACSGTKQISSLARNLLSTFSL